MWQLGWSSAAQAPTTRWRTAIGSPGGAVGASLALGAAGCRVWSTQLRITRKVAAVQISARLVCAAGTAAAGAWGQTDGKAEGALRQGLKQVREHEHVCSEHACSCGQVRPLEPHSWPVILAAPDAGVGAAGEGEEGAEEDEGAGEAPRPVTMPAVRLPDGWRFQPEEAFRKQQLGQSGALPNTLLGGGNKGSAAHVMSRCRLKLCRIGTEEIGLQSFQPFPIRLTKHRSRREPGTWRSMPQRLSQRAAGC